ncbi:MAG TPA: GGDEF domain-containing protein [Usitatibacter sp.]|nr:GGDEF domain-containing protein [Usitatibacter sp.]
MTSGTRLLHRLHASLMPDYNRAAAAYWCGLILVGVAVLAVALHAASLRPAQVQLQILAVCVASMLAGGFPVPLPGTKSSFSAAEIFIFLALLYVGLDAACLAAAAEAFIASARTSKRWTSRLVSPAVAALSIGVTGGLFLQITAALEARQLYNDGTLLGLLPAMAVVHFLLTGWMVRMVLHLKSEKPLRIARLLGNFGWIGSTYAANAFIAALLFLTARQAGAIVLLAAGPMIALLLTTLHFHFRQREAEAAQARALVEAAEREAAHTARHNAELRRVAGGTGSLLDRAGFVERLAEVLQRDGGMHRAFAMVYLDVDRFRRIHETLGPAAGEEFLVHVANRIQRRVRGCDLVARLGDDEFTVLVRDVDGHRVAELARRLVKALARPYAVGGVTVESSTSIGITLGAYAYETPEDMLRDAHSAMCEAKSLGGARYVVHRPDVLQRIAVPEGSALLEA